MSVIRSQSFEYKQPDWVNDPSVPEEDKRILIEEMGMGGSISSADAMDVQDDCFVCGNKLGFPYIYWHGSGDDRCAKGISLHPACAVSFSKGILRDAAEIANS
jgi:hypothetical protein